MPQCETDSSRSQRFASSQSKESRPSARRTDHASNRCGRDGEASLTATWKSNGMTSIGSDDRAATEFTTLKRRSLADPFHDWFHEMTRIPCLTAIKRVDMTLAASTAKAYKPRRNRHFSPNNTVRIAGFISLGSRVRVPLSLLILWCCFVARVFNVTFL